MSIIYFAEETSENKVGICSEFRSDPEAFPEVDPLIRRGRGVRAWGACPFKKCYALPKEAVERLLEETVKGTEEEVEWFAWKES